jgi:hypothetical protein
MAGRGTQEDTMRVSRIASLVAAGAILLAVAAPAGAATSTQLRVLHASPDAPAVDVWVDGTKVLTDVAFKDLSGYLDVPAGAHNIKVVATGTTSPAVIDATPSFAAGKSYTVAAIGMLADIKPAVFVDNAAGMSGDAMLRVVHLSPDAPAVDVAVKGQSADQAPVKALEFPDATGYLTLAPASYDFEVRLAGTTTVALPLDGVTLDDGTNYTVFAVGLAAAGSPADQALTVVVGVDGMALPATDTLPETGSPSNLGAIVLMAAGAAFLVIALSLRMRTARSTKS